MTGAIVPIRPTPARLRQDLRRPPDTSTVRWDTQLLAAIGEVGPRRSFASYDQGPCAPARRGFLDEDHPGEIFDITV